jgi:hypothetical protein
MTRLEQYRVIRQGSKVWNQWRRDNPPSLPDLSELKYREAELSGANLRTGANLTRAKFAHTIFGDTNLTGALGLDACDIQRSSDPGNSHFPFFGAVDSRHSHQISAFTPESGI